MAEQKYPDVDDEKLFQMIICVGSAGLGKSSTIKTYCNDEHIRVSSGAQSCTQDPKIWFERDDNEQIIRIWVDTIGAEDTSDTIHDKDVLRKVMQMIIRELPNNFKLEIKLLWFTKREIRATKTLQAQAEFIGAFGANTPHKAWNSTIIIVKQGELNPGLDAQGALVAAAKKGATRSDQRDEDGELLGKVKHIGFTRLDLLPSNSGTLRIANQISDEDRIAQGWLTKDEAVSRLSALLSSISFLEVQVKKQKCIKCGIIGDKRWVPTACHPGSIDIHPQAQNLKHTQPLKWEHQISGYEWYHYGGVEYYHRLGKETKYGSSYHKGLQQKVESGRACFNGHSGLSFTKCTSGSFECNRCKGKMYVGAEMYYCTKCTPNNFNYKINGKGSWKSCHYHPGCTKVETYYRWDCCYKKIGSGGCTKDSEEVYGCCYKKAGSGGCTPRFSCCRNIVGSSGGCRKRHICCKKPSGSQGCMQIYGCCNRKPQDGQCSYSCCNRRVGSAPCVTKCRNCPKKWGEGPGCIEDQVEHQMQNL